jgi:uncharacterized protein YggE
MTKSILSALIIGAAFLTASPVQAHNVGNNHEAMASQKRLLPVRATAEIKLDPDKASISAGVVTEGKNASETALENAAKMTEVFKALRSAGVAEADIKTTQLSLSPRYNYESKRKPLIVGYTADNPVTVNTFDLNKVSPIVDALIQAGANNIENVQFGLRDVEAIEAQVLEKAIQKARAKAQLMARSAGVSLGDLQSLTVGHGGFSRNNQGFDEVIVTASKRGGGGERISTPISQGELTIKATVNLVYEMR